MNNDIPMHQMSVMTSQSHNIIVRETVSQRSSFRLTMAQLRLVFSWRRLAFCCYLTFIVLPVYVNSAAISEDLTSCSTLHRIRARCATVQHRYDAELENSTDTVSDIIATHHECDDGHQAANHNNQRHCATNHSRHEQSPPAIRTFHAKLLLIRAHVLNILPSVLVYLTALLVVLHVLMEVDILTEGAVIDAMLDIVLVTCMVCITLQQTIAVTWRKLAGTLTSGLWALRLMVKEERDI